MHDQASRGNAGLAIADAGVLLEPTRQEEQRNQRNQHHTEAGCVEQHQRHTREQHVEQAGDHLVAACVEQFLNRIEVAGLARNHAARGVFLVELEAQLLGVHEHSLAQVENHILIDLGRKANEEVGEARGRGCRQQVCTDCPPKCYVVALDGVRQSLVDAVCDQSRANHTEGLAQNHGREADHQSTANRANQAAQQAHRTRAKLLGFGLREVNLFFIVDALHTHASTSFSSSRLAIT